MRIGRVVRTERNAWPRHEGSPGSRESSSASVSAMAFARESGVSSDRIGKVIIRDGYTIAEVAAVDAATVIEKMNGVELKGRRVSARVDDRPAREPREAGRERGGREGRSGPRAGRGGFA